MSIVIERDQTGSESLHAADRQIPVCTQIQIVTTRNQNKSGFIQTSTRLSHYPVAFFLHISSMFMLSLITETSNTHRLTYLLLIILLDDLVECI